MNYFDELKSPSILALPHSKQNYKSIFLEIGFWEKRAIFSHEFGHHIFSHYASKFYEETVKGQYSFSELISERYNASKSNLLVQTAINEMYADMIAYYAHNSGLDPLGGFVLGRIKKDRDIASCNCDDAQVKELSQIILDIYFFVRSGNNNFHDPHTIGAFLATGINRLWADRFGSQKNDPKTAQKFSLLQKWLKNLDSFYTKNSFLKGQDLLEKMLYDAINFSRSSVDSSFSEDQCLHMKESFPAFYKSWKKRKRLQNCSN